MTIWEMMQWLGHHNVNSTQHYVRRKQQRVAVAYTKAERNSLLIEALVETKADPHGNLKVYYVLGDDGLCSNPEWATCIYRLACRKCPFFIPKEQARQIRSGFHTNHHPSGYFSSFLLFFAEKRKENVWREHSTRKLTNLLCIHNAPIWENGWHSFSFPLSFVPHCSYSVLF